MKNRTNKLAFLVFVTSLGFSGLALGEVNFEITSTQPNNLGGVYTDPYNVLVNGVPIAAFCDDFIDNVNPPESWQATVTDLLQITGSTSTVLYGNGSGSAQIEDYIAAAYLASESLPLYQNVGNASDVNAANDYSYALWAIFDPDLLSSSCSPGSEGCITGADLSTAIADLAAARTLAHSYIVNNPLNSAAAFEAANNITNVEIYTPILWTPNPSAPHNGRPQEFITVKMAEAPSVGILAADLLGVGMLGYFLRRRAVTRNN